MGRSSDRKRGDQLAHLVVERAFAAEMLVMRGDFEHPLARGRSGHAGRFRERQHVLHFLGPAESDDEQGIVRQ